MKIAILGGGSWGSALAIYLSDKNHQVRVWEFFPQQAQEMQERRVCPLLPEVQLPEKVVISSEMRFVLQGSELVLVAVPSDKVESTMETAMTELQSQPVIVCSKGFAHGVTLLTEIVCKKVAGPVYCLYGPTHAEEVSKKKLSGMVLAGGNGKEKLKKELETNFVKIDLSNDIIGVQVSAALKNILALCIGILDGLEMGDNAQAYIITKGLEEIKQVGMKWGAEERTFYGLAGIGDIIVTSLSNHSRNRLVGQKIGRGQQLLEIMSEMKMVAEGVNTLRAVPELKKRFGLSLPLMSAVYDMVIDGKNPGQILFNM